MLRTVVRSYLFRPIMSILNRQLSSVSNPVVVMMEHSNSLIVKDVSFEKFNNFFSSKHKLQKEDVLQASILLDGGLTVPFIARYRRDLIGCLEPTHLFELKHNLDSFANLIKSRNAKIKKLEESGKLTDLLRKSFMNCLSESDLDELWSPYKEKHSSNSSKARSIVGVLELAEFLLLGVPNEKYYLSLRPILIPTELQSTIPTIESAVKFVLTDMIAHDPEVKKLARELLRGQYVLNSELVFPKTSLKGDDLQKFREKHIQFSKFKDYHNFNKALHKIPAHQLLAIRRGCGEGKSSNNIDNDQHLTAHVSEKYDVQGGLVSEQSSLDSTYNSLIKPQVLKQQPVFSKTLLSSSVRKNVILSCIHTAVKKSIVTSLCNETYKDLLKSADLQAIDVFARNLHKLLLTPPLESYFKNQQRNLLVIDPGFSNGHKVAVLSLTTDGSSPKRLLLMKKFYVRRNAEAADMLAMSEELKNICVANDIRLIVIGDGMGSNQAVQIVQQIQIEMKLAVQSGNKRQRCNDSSANELHYVIVSECGASVYSALPIAKEEFPDIDISYLGCISLGRRLVDPLAELVKIPPESLGIGMYQHDISPKLLQSKLTEVVEMCVNDVGVDINTANVHILKYISGINDSKAKSIIAYRDSLSSNKFNSVSEINNVKGIFLNNIDMCWCYNGLF